MDRVRQREEGTSVGENPGADRYLGKGQGQQGGKWDRGSQARLSKGTPLSRPEWEESKDEWWRSGGGSAVLVDGCSATGRDRGGKKRVKRDREAELTGKIWEGNWDRSGGREKRNA